MTHKERWLWATMLLAVILFAPLRNTMAGMFSWAFIIALALFLLLVIPAILGATMGKMTGATIRIVKERFPQRRQK